MVAENSARVGVFLGAVIAVGAVMYVYGRRRRRTQTGVLVLPLLFVMFFSGCVRTVTIPEGQRMLRSYPLTRTQALERLEVLSRTIQSIQTQVNLDASTPKAKEENKRTETP